jgi:hypothetical protein
MACVISRCIAGGVGSTGGTATRAATGLTGVRLCSGGRVAARMSVGERRDGEHISLVESLCKSLSASIPRFLRTAVEEGWRVVGAAVSADAFSARALPRGPPTLIGL